MRFPRQGYWSGLPFPLPGQFQTQELNLNLLHWQADSLLLSHQGNPKATILQLKTNKRKKNNPKERKLILKYPCFFLAEPQGLWSALPFPVFLWLLTWSASKSSFSGFCDTWGSRFSSRTAHLWFIHWLFLPPSPATAISPQLSPHLPFSPLLIAALDFACLALKC